MIEEVFEYQGFDYGPVRFLVDTYTIEAPSIFVVYVRAHVSEFAIVMIASFGET